MSRLRQSGYKKGSSIILSLPAVSLFSRPLLSDTVFSQLTGFLHRGHCALSPLGPQKIPLCQQRHLSLRQLLPLCSACQCLGCAVVSLCTEPSFFTPFFHPPHPICLPPLSCWPPEGSTPHCHECSILVGNKWIQQMMSGTGIQCGGKMFPGAP